MEKCQNNWRNGYRRKSLNNFIKNENMGVKNNNPKNSIIIEGLWGLGKTLIAKRYCEKFDYKFVAEPMHTEEERFEEIKDVDSWYINQHTKRLSYLRDSEKIFLERSILSSFAFLHSLKKRFPDIALIDDLKKIIQKKKVLVVYLRSENKKKLNNLTHFKKYSEVIRGIISNFELRSRYENWYENMLPKKYGITPFILNVFDQDNIRRSVGEIANEINLVLRCNRIAQVNVVCFAKLFKDSKNIKILILKRNEEKGGFWQTITGGVHIGEDLRDAAQREVFEEIGISCDKTELFLTPLAYSFMGDDGYFLKEYVFGCEINDPEKIRISKEHDSVEWVDFNEATGRVAYENNKKAIDAVVKKIGSQAI